jgi:hypothetical protein
MHGRIKFCERCIRGHTVAWLVEALCYKPEGRVFDSLCHWNFSICLAFQLHYGPGVYSASNRNKYQKSSWGVKGDRNVRLTTSPSVSRLSRKCGTLTSHNPMGLHGLLDNLTFFTYMDAGRQNEEQHYWKTSVF